MGRPRTAIRTLAAATLAAFATTALAGCSTVGGPNACTASDLDGARQVGRATALIDLRLLPIWRMPSHVCADRVSRLADQAESPSWESRAENMEIIRECREDALHNAIIVNRQRQALKDAQ